jgi:hypothetical protein
MRGANLPRNLVGASRLQRGRWSDDPEVLTLLEPSPAEDDQVPGGTHRKRIDPDLIVVGLDEAGMLNRLAPGAGP